MTENNSRLALLVVTYQPGRYLLELLESLPSATEAQVEVILANNAAHDRCLAANISGYDNIRIVETGGNLGYGAGMNCGYRAWRADNAAEDAEFVLLANPDVQFHPGAIDELVACARRHPEAAAVGPRIIEADGSTYPSARALPSLVHGIGHALFADLWPSNPFSARYRQNEDMDKERTAGWLSGSCLLVRTAAFEAVGGFDERYFMYFEDTDLGDRFSREGYSNIYCPSAVISHAQGHSTDAVSSAMTKVHHESAGRYLTDRLTGWALWPVRMALRVGLTLRAAIAIKAAR